MTEPFVDDEGDIVEREQGAVELELRVIKTMGAKFNAAMAALHAVGLGLTEHGEGDMNSLLAALKVSEINGKLIEVAQEWLNNRGAG